MVSNTGQSIKAHHGIPEQDSSRDLCAMAFHDGPWEYQRDMLALHLPPWSGPVSIAVCCCVRCVDTPARRLARVEVMGVQPAASPAAPLASDVSYDAGGERNQ